MQVPAQRRGLHETLISLETSSDVPAILFHFGLDFPVWQGARPRTPNMNYIYVIQSNFLTSNSVTRRKAFLGFQFQMS